MCTTRTSPRRTAAAPPPQRAIRVSSPQSDTVRLATQRRASQERQGSSHYPNPNPMLLASGSHERPQAQSEKGLEWNPQPGNQPFSCPCGGTSAGASPQPCPFHSSHNNTRLVSEPSISATSFYCRNSWEMQWAIQTFSRHESEEEEKRTYLTA